MFIKRFVHTGEALDTEITNWLSTLPVVTGTDIQVLQLPGAAVLVIVRASPTASDPGAANLPTLRSQLFTWNGGSQILSPVPLFRLYRGSVTSRSYLYDKHDGKGHRRVVRVDE